MREGPLQLEFNVGKINHKGGSTLFLKLILQGRFEAWIRAAVW
jgi:hypothetical protein